MAFRRGSILLVSLLVIFLMACGGKPEPEPVVVEPPPPPPPPAPTATLQAQPSVILKGQSATLRWNSSDATDLTLDPGQGAVGPEGSVSVSPAESTTYTLTAIGQGGQIEATARVTVNEPPPPPEPPPPARPTAAEAFASMVDDAYFDYDKSEIRPDGEAALRKTARFFFEYPEASVLIEGHADERGSTEYNLGLGDRRAEAAKQFLMSLGVAEGRLEKISYGEERPFCTEREEICWQQNRRSHFVLLPSGGGE